MPPLPDGTKISVALVDDHPIFLEGLEAVFRREDPFEVVAKAITAEEAFAAAATHRPDLIVLDMFLPDGGARLINRITTVTPMSRIVVLSVSARESDIAAAFDAGASAYLVKGISANELRSSLMAIQNGHTFILPPALPPVASQPSAVRPGRSPKRHANITAQEYSVLSKIAEGMSNKEVARDLSISEKTLKSHLTTVFSKLGVRNRVEAINVFRDSVSADDGSRRPPQSSERK
jgi:two-component system nitrate/nitrite response regulator NarL